MRGVENVVANLTAANRAIPNEQRAGMQRATYYLKGQIVRNRFSGPTGDESVSVQTGRARQSIQTEVTSRGNVIEGRVGSPVEYVRHLEEGTHPYDIVPKVKRALRFVIGGAVVFARRVHHPGLKARHMFRDEARQQTSVMIRILGHDVVARIVAVGRGR